MTPKEQFDIYIKAYKSVNSNRLSQAIKKASDFSVKIARGGGGSMRSSAGVGRPRKPNGSMKPLLNWFNRNKIKEQQDALAQQDSETKAALAQKEQLYAGGFREENNRPLGPKVDVDRQRVIDKMTGNTPITPPNHNINESAKEIITGPGVTKFEPAPFDTPANTVKPDIVKTPSQIKQEKQREIFRQQQRQLEYQKQKAEQDRIAERNNKVYKSAAPLRNNLKPGTVSANGLTEQWNQKIMGTQRGNMEEAVRKLLEMVKDFLGTIPTQDQTLVNQ